MDGMGLEHILNSGDVNSHLCLRGRRKYHTLLLLITVLFNFNKVILNQCNEIKLMLRTIFLMTLLNGAL